MCAAKVGEIGSHGHHKPNISAIKQQTRKEQKGLVGRVDGEMDGGKGRRIQKE